MIGSVNTIINRDGRLIGTNTDAFGFHKALREKTGINDKKIAVLGSGGSAKAVCFALLYYSKPSEITIIARNKTAREELKANLTAHFPQSADKIDTIPLEDWEKRYLDFDILINTTSIGMQPYINNCIIPGDKIRKDSTVMDIVYRPNQTKLLDYALQNGCIAVYGIDMLLYQGMKQFEIWTGEHAPENVMRKVLENQLKG